jgi:hypothetical protein
MESASIALGLAITGFGIRRAQLTREELGSLPRRHLGARDVFCITGRRVSHVDEMVGARLVDVLALLGLGDNPRAELKQCVIVAHARDGYRAIFSWNELHNTAVGEQVIVVYERSGAPLGGNLGDLCLLSGNDLHLGPRHLRHLCGVTVQHL